MSNKNILLVEDDQNLGFVIEDNLSVRGYNVLRCVDGLDGLDTFRSGAFDLCILDVMLPKMDGFSLARSIREQDKRVPIIFLTAKSMLDDKLEGFGTGGDDYIVKPFSMEELVCRMEVFLRRIQSKDIAAPQPEQYSIGAYTFDVQNLTLRCQQYSKVLTQKEADILKCFCKNKGLVIRREEILNDVWGTDDYFVGRSMDVFISKLRKYLAKDPQIEIVNYHGVGFKLKVEG